MDDLSGYWGLLFLILAYPQYSILGIALILSIQFALEFFRFKELSEIYLIITNILYLPISLCCLAAFCDLYPFDLRTIFQHLLLALYTFMLHIGSFSIYFIFRKREKKKK